MPAKCGGTVLTADAVIEETANPMPTSPNGTISVRRRLMGIVAAYNSPAAITAKPPSSSQRARRPATSTDCH